MNKTIVFVALIALVFTVACKKKKEEASCTTARVNFRNTTADALTVDISMENETSASFTSVALTFNVPANSTWAQDIPTGARQLRWKRCSTSTSCVNVKQTVINYAGCSTGTELAEVMVASDARYKYDFGRIESAVAMKKLMQLNPLSYKYDFNRFPKLNAVPGRTFGFVAQELESIFPETVVKDESGMVSVNYTALIPVLTSVLQEQQREIELLKRELKAIKSDK